MAMLCRHMPPSHNQIQSHDPNRHRTIVQSLLEQRTPVSFRVEGPSMTPTLRDGDLVEVLPCPAVSLQRGAIVLFAQSGRLTLHRYVGASRAYPMLRMAGDAALSGMEQVERDKIYGVAATRERNGRRTRMDTRRQRWQGLCRFYARPMRRAISALTPRSGKPA